MPYGVHDGEVASICPVSQGSGRVNGEFVALPIVLNSQAVEG